MIRWRRKVSAIYLIVLLVVVVTRDDVGLRSRKVLCLTYRD